jgi:hypothetical protein
MQPKPPALLSSPPVTVAAVFALPSRFARVWLVCAHPSQLRACADESVEELRKQLLIPGVISTRLPNGKNHFLNIVMPRRELLDEMNKVPHLHSAACMSRCGG